MAAPGPKAYVTIDSTGATDITFKGITQNHATTFILTPDSIKDLVLNQNNQKVSVLERQFIIDKKEMKIKISVNDKDCSMSYRKRIILDDLSTIPFGYNRKLLNKK